MKKYKWLFYVVTFLLLVVVATVLQEIGFRSSYGPAAVLVIGLIYGSVYLITKFVKWFSKRYDFVSTAQIFLFPLVVILAVFLWRSYTQIRELENNLRGADTKSEITEPSKLPSTKEILQEIISDPDKYGVSEETVKSIEDMLSGSSRKTNSFSERFVSPDHEEVQEDSYPSSDTYSDFRQHFDQKCQEQQAEYNTCMIRYNTELLEWQSCQSSEKPFGCPPSSWKPHNSCGANISSWCRKQILGY